MSQYHDEELDFLNKRNNPDFRIVRTYKFEKGTTNRAFVCRLWFPDWPEDMNQNPAMIIQFDLGEPSQKRVLQNRVHVWAHWSVPNKIAIAETCRFFDIISKMYDL